MLADAGGCWRMLADAGVVGDALEDRGTPNLLLHMPCPIAVL